MNVPRFFYSVAMAGLSPSRYYSRLRLSTALGQQQQTQAAAGNTTTVQFPNSPIPVILLEYERLTGTTVIRDGSVQDQNLDHSVRQRDESSRSGPVYREEFAAEWIRACWRRKTPTR